MPSRTSSRKLGSTTVRSSAALGPLYLLAEPAGWFIPAGRFPGLIVAGIAGAQLRHPVRH
jgi:hypothetical protein